MDTLFEQISDAPKQQKSIKESKSKSKSKSKSPHKGVPRTKKEDRLYQIEKDVKKMKGQIEDLNMAIDLIKNYGFQPKQFD